MDHEIMGEQFKANGQVDQGQWDVLEKLLERQNMLAEAQKTRLLDPNTLSILWVDQDNDRQSFRRYLAANQAEADRQAALDANETGIHGIKIGKQ